MAYTSTTSGGSATLVGTAKADTLTATTGITKDIQVSSLQEADIVNVTTSISSGNIGMGGGKDKVDVNAGGTLKKTNITLGDSADTFVSVGDDASITVGGQGGADTFTLTGASATRTTRSRYAGGQGADIFSGTTGLLTTIVGGSENDVIGSATKTLTLGQLNFVNGQVGSDKIDIAENGSDTTVRGGSQADTIDASDSATGISLYGDDGADKVLGSSAGDKLFGGGGADTITGGAGADTITLGLGKDTVVFTATATADTVKDFTVADDIASMDISALNAATSGTFTNGNGDAVAAGDAAVVQAVSGATTITAKVNVINWTATAGAADAAALDTAVSAVAFNLTGAAAVGDQFVFQYNTAAGVQKLAIGEATAVTGTKIDTWDFADISNNGSIADLTAANYTFVA